MSNKIWRYIEVLRYLLQDIIGLNNTILTHKLFVLVRKITQTP